MTPSSVKAQRPVNAVLGILISAFPVFRNAQPLAIGIHKEIRRRRPDIGDKPLRVALQTHTASTSYLKALSKGEARFDLDGHAAGTVTSEQRQLAHDLIKDRFQKTAERKKLERQQQEQQEKLLKLADKFNRR